MTRASLKKSGFATLGFLVLLLALPPVSPVFAQTYGHSFYGSVKIDGVNAEPGTEVTAWTEGAGGSGSCEVTTAGQYVLTVQSDNPNVEGETVHFYVKPAGSTDLEKADQTFPFHDGWVVYLDLTVTTPTYDLTMAAEPGEGGAATDLTDDSPYAAGEEVSIKAEASDGYRFVNWTAQVPSGGGEFGDAEEVETTFIMPAEAVIVTAHFELLPTFDLNMAVAPPGGGTAFDLTGESPYVEGSPVSIKAEPATGYRFVNWTAQVPLGGEFGDAEAAETTFTVPGQDVTVTANFEEVLTQMSFYGSVKVDGVNAEPGTEITAEVEGGGGTWVVTTPGQYVLSVQGSAIAEGATTHFYVDGEETDQTFPFHNGWIVQFDLTVTAPTYELTMAADPEEGGTAIDLTDGSPYEEGKVVSIKADPAAGYQFGNWTATASVQFVDPNVEETTFAMPAEAVTVTASFDLVAVVPTVTTQNATDVTMSFATMNMDYTVGDYSQVEVCFAYRIPDETMDWSYTDWALKEADGTHAEELTLAGGLELNAMYDFMAQLRYNDVIDGILTIEGDILHFATIATAGCFIATAAYGTPMADEIQALRDFRDEYLITNPPGRALVDIYYRLSPPIAQFITDHPSLKPIVRAVLVPAVAMSTIAVNTTPIEKMTIVGLLVLVSVALAVWATRRRGRGLAYT